MPARNPALPKVSDETIRAVKNTVLGRLYGRAPLPNLVGLDAPLNSIYALLSQTALNSEGNSALILGPRGSGKTSLVHRALSMLSQTHTSKANYHVVHLNGFVHTTDRIALRDIARQLLIKQDLEHVLIGSFADAFTYILNLLRSDDESTAIPPVIFVLEEFDLLAQHPKQSLLYTLFDIAQSQQTPIAVLGVTARIDVLDLLEKRVKSRFSHRQIYVHNMASVEEFVQIAREALCIDPSHTVSEAFARQFNMRIEDILTSRTVSQHIEDIFEFGKDVRQLLRAFSPAVSQLTTVNPLLNASTVESQLAQTNTSAKMQIISSISLLELCLIIAMRSLMQLGSTKYNFEMVYDEYKTFMSRHMMAVSAGGAMKIYKKPVALKAFETLVELEIARPALMSVGEGSSVHGRNDLLAGTAGGIRAPKEYRMVQLMLEPSQVVELVSGRIDIPAVIRRWAQQ
ncbi:origin recognition complex subunit 4 [Coemansia sp. RSA 720]|nr:origin recognition complex subunit 4 [Coemansia sp. RSA 720]